MGGESSICWRWVGWWLELLTSGTGTWLASRLFRWEFWPDVTFETDDDDEEEEEDGGGGMGTWLCSRADR